MTVLDRGQTGYLFGGTHVTIPAQELCVRWGAIPHQNTDVNSGGVQLSLKIPLPWFLQWQLPDSFVNSLIRGKLFLDREADPGCSDWAMLGGWHELLQGDTPERKRIVLLETEARLRRMALRTLVDECRAGRDRGAFGQLGKVDAMVSFIATHYTDDINVEEIAGCVSLHPRSAMRLFRESCGMTLWEYLTSHRVWHAQRLLAASEMKVRQVASACGSNSPGRFYVAFKRIVGQLPRDYRTTVRAT